MLQACEGKSCVTFLAHQAGNVWTEAAGCWTKIGLL